MRKHLCRNTGLLFILLCLSSCQSLQEDKDLDPVPPQNEFSILTEVKNAAVLSDINRTPEISQNESGYSAKLDGIVVPSDYEIDLTGIAEMEPSPSETRNMDVIFQKLFGDGDPGEVIKVAINFDAATLADVVPSFATPLEINYILDNDVTGSITMSVNDNLTIEEVWKLFEQILTLSDTYCELDGRVLHIRPLSKITREQNIFESDSNIEAKIIPLKYVAASAIIAQISRLLPSENAVIALEQQNSLLVVETRSNIDRLETLITQLDRKPRRGWSQVVIQCTYVPSAQIKDELLKVMPVLGFPVTDGLEEKLPGAISLTSIDRVQVLVASSVTPESLAELRRWAKILDRPENSDQEGVFLYEVVNARADELLQALSVVFPVDGSSPSRDTGNSGTGGSSSPQGSRAQERNPNDPVKTTETIFDTPVKIFADSVQNRLLIRTTPRAYAMIDAILKRLDTIPTQILLQVLVVEIELNDNNEFGMEFSIKGGSGNAETIFDTNFEGLQPSGPPGQAGGKFYIFNPSNPDEKFGYIRALAGRSRLRVLSSPQILATSHSEAKISVGKRVPIVTSDITDTASSVTDNTSLRRSYTYEDTGIILTVTPQATKGGYISMEIKQVISDAIENSMKGIDSPIIKEDELNTTLALRDGRTLIMGGLIREKYNESVSSVPIIADIPFLKNIFGNTTQITERTEILVLITATIITEETELQNNIRRYNESIEAILRFEHKQFEKHLKPETPEEVVDELDGNDKE